MNSNDIPATIDQLKVGTKVKIIEPFLYGKEGIIKAFNHGFVMIKLHKFGILAFWPEKLSVIKDNDMIQSSSSIAINDHICPTCSNNRCSKNEITCWKCGSKL